MKTTTTPLTQVRRSWRTLTHAVAVFFRELTRFLRPVLATAILTGSGARAGETYVFGDSGADMGNFHALPGFEPSATSPYYRGPDGLVRLSDGPMWPELLWPEMASFSGPGVGRASAMNFSFGGARSDGGSFIGDDVESLPIGLLSQLDGFEAGVRQGMFTIGDGTRAVLYAGTNDLFEAVATGADVNAAIHSVTRNLETAVNRLAATGVKTIYVSEIADFGHAAAFHHTGLPADQEQALRDALNAIGAAAREQVRSVLAAANTRLAGTSQVVLLPLNDLFSAVREDPTAYGFANMTGMIYDDSNDRILETDPARRAGYFFVDGLHTTARAQRLEAAYYGAVIDVVEGPAQRRVGRIVDGAMAATEALGRVLTDRTSREEIAGGGSRGWSLFAAVPAAHRRLDATTTEESVRIDTGAVSVGLQWPGSSEPALTLALGFFGQGGRVGGDALRFDQQGIDVAVANAKEVGPVRLGAEVGYTLLTVDTRRDTGIPAASGTLRAESDGWASRARLTASRVFSFKNWTIDVSGGLAYDRIEYDSFSEEGMRGLRATYEEIDHESFRGMFGTDLAVPEIRAWGGRLRPSLALRARYEMADDTIDVAGTLEGNVIHQFVGRASLGDRFHAQIEPKLEFIAASGTRVSLSYGYESDFEDFEQQNIWLTLGHRF